MKTRTTFRVLGFAIEETDVKRELHTTLEAPTEVRDTTARRTARCSFAPFFALSWRLPMGWAGIVAGLESVRAGEREGGGCLEKVERIFFIGEKLTLQRTRYAYCLQVDAPPQKASRLGSLISYACSSACFVFLLSFPRLLSFPVGQQQHSGKRTHRSSGSLTAAAVAQGRSCARIGGGRPCKTRGWHR